MAGPKDAQASLEHQNAWRQIFAQNIREGPITRGFDSYFGTDVPNWPPFCFIEDDRTLGIPSQFLPARLFENHQASQQGPALQDRRLEPILPNLGRRAHTLLAAAAKNEPFFLYLPLTSPHTPLAVNPDFLGKCGLTLYADFVMEIDALIGQLLDTLEHTGTAGRTVILFTSDNGCAPYIGVAEMRWW